MSYILYCLLVIILIFIIKKFYIKNLSNLFQLTAIVDSTDDAILTKSIDGIITSWNRGAEKMFGYLKNEAIGKNIFLIFPKELEYEESNITKVLLQGKVIHNFETK